MSKLFPVKIVAFLLVVSSCRADSCSQDSVLIDKASEQLRLSVAAIKTYQCDIEYLFEQPLFDSKTLRKGKLYYKRYNDRSDLRINFLKLKQDQEKEKPFREDYIFDSVWLTHIDYQLKQAKRYQKAEPNEPVDAFELAARNFPMIGFSRAEDMEKDFEIKLAQQPKDDQNLFTKLYLKVKKGSVYKDDYTSMEFWIDKKSNLPARILAVTTEDDIYRIELTRAKVNKGIDKKIFEIKIPDSFAREEMNLKQDSK